MLSVTRRDFVKRTTLGIAALGALAAVPPIPALAQGVTSPPSGAAQPAPMPVVLPNVSLAGGEPFVVYVSDPSSGAGTILVGERAIPFANGAIVQSLQQAIA